MCIFNISTQDLLSPLSVYPFVRVENIFLSSNIVKELSVHYNRWTDYNK